MKSLYAGIGLLLAVVVVAVGFKLANHHPLSTGLEATVEAPGLHPTVQKKDELDELSEEQRRFVQKIAIQLLEKYGEQIHLRPVQAQMRVVYAHVMEAYPQDGAELFQRVLLTAFPHFIDEIRETLALLADYDEWLERNYLALSEMPPLERGGTLWEKRRALFGEDAGQIWADEDRQTARQQQAQAELERLDQAHDESLDETLFQLRSSLEQIYSRGDTSMVMDNGLVSQVYFGLDSVQRKLQALDPESRQQQVNDVRRQLGYSEERIGQLETRDQKRNERWENGSDYMKERQSLADTLREKELDSALAELRERYFKHEAITITKEEAQGFFRYERPRLFGRN